MSYHLTAVRIAIIKKSTNNIWSHICTNDDNILSTKDYISNPTVPNVKKKKERDRKKKKKRDREGDRKYWELGRFRSCYLTYNAPHSPLVPSNSSPALLVLHSQPENRIISGFVRLYVFGRPLCLEELASTPGGCRLRPRQKRSLSNFPNWHVLPLCLQHQQEEVQNG